MLGFKELLWASWAAPGSPVLVGRSAVGIVWLLGGGCLLLQSCLEPRRPAKPHLGAAPCRDADFYTSGSWRPPSLCGALGFTYQLLSLERAAQPLQGRFRIIVIIYGWILDVSSYGAMIISLIVIFLNTLASTYASMYESMSASITDSMSESYMNYS